MFEVLARDRVRDVNLPVGLSNREGTLLFYEVPGVAGFSTFSTERAEDLRRKGYSLIEHSIPVTTLARVCEQHAAPTIDFLKIDVEGHEREVLEGADWGRFRPRVVLVEATRPDTSIPSHDDWEALLLAADYLFAFFDGLNRYYLRVEDRELPAAPQRAGECAGRVHTFRIPRSDPTPPASGPGASASGRAAPGLWRNPCAWASRAAASGSFARDSVITASSSSAHRPWAR